MVAVTVWRSTIVRPAEPTPAHRLWISSLDFVAPPVHWPVIYFFRTNGSEDFFDAARMRDALARVLVPFYTMAGRLARDEKGRIEIDCRGQGVLFVEADSVAILDDFGDFAPTKEVKQLVVEINRS